MDLVKPNDTNVIIAAMLAALSAIFGIVWRTKPTRVEMILANAKTAEVALAANDELRREFDNKIAGAITAAMAADAVNDDLKINAVKVEIAGGRSIVDTIHDDVKFLLRSGGHNEGDRKS